MALDNNGIRFILHAWKNGVSFARTAMIGRQVLFPEAKAFHLELSKFGFNLSLKETQELLKSSEGYAEDFFKLVGAEVTDSFDASSYENATYVHDFNQPLNDDQKGKYSAVIDGGTLEHIFNFPMAIKNCMELVEEGGHFLSLAPTNNFMGHGFYQFSPELFFRILSPENGFEIQKIFIHEWLSETQWYEVTDPEEVRERVTLINYYPSLLLVIAKRTKIVEIFKTNPQQSDYSVMWEHESESSNSTRIYTSPNAVAPMSLRRVLRLPRTGLSYIRRRLRLYLSMLNRNPKHFKKTNIK